MAIFRISVLHTLIDKRIALFQASQWWVFVFIIGPKLHTNILIIGPKLHTLKNWNAKIKAALRWFNSMLCDNKKQNKWCKRSIG